MIISHKYKYVFIELSRTASEAISCELCEFYAGERILWKHASYRDFEKIAGSKEKKYYGSSIYYEWKTKDFDKLNYIYRFENLQDDFREILKRLKIKQVRPLPVINQSFGRRADIYYYFPAE